MIDQLVRAFHPFDVEARVKLNHALQNYAKALSPWAEATATAMLVDVMRRDEKIWRHMSRQMGFAIQHELHSSPVGDLVRAAMARQVGLITSLPLKAGKRIHEIAMGDLYTGARAAELAVEILKTGHVTKSLADTIARTEVSRASSELTKARAQGFGSEGYVWRTARDLDVRPLHKKLEGKFFKWTEPPITGSSGERSLPGGIYNCRCYPEPVIPRR
jgi:SPP1 gp7 family putative phage head morphogenesis protein